MDWNHEPTHEEMQTWTLDQLNERISELRDEQVIATRRVNYWTDRRTQLMDLLNQAQAAYENRTKTINLPIFGINITLVLAPDGKSRIGEIKSDLVRSFILFHNVGNKQAVAEFKEAVFGFQQLILEMAKQDIDLTTPFMLKAIETACKQIANVYLS